jgi:hypothetical protein
MINRVSREIDRKTKVAETIKFVAAEELHIPEWVTCTREHSTQRVETNVPETEER